MLESVKDAIDYVLANIFQPIQSFMKFQRINALANVLIGSKGTPAGHRGRMKSRRRSMNRNLQV